MSNNGESGSRILAALITSAAMVIVAIIGYSGIKLQTLTPIYATLTAQPPTVVVTMNSPKFKINNKLHLPIKISIDGKYAGEVEGKSSKVFLLKSYPAKVSWAIIKMSLPDGLTIGHDMGASFYNVTDNQEITIDNVVGDQQYFYPIITNNTDKNCLITINYSWGSSYTTHASLNAHKKNVAFGYYKLFSTSNVLLNCDGKISWWGLRSDNQGGESFYEKVEKETGSIYFTLNPP